jgi:hypothetical protein
MSQRFSTVALNAQHGHTVIQDLWKWVKAMTVGGHRISIEAKPETRSTAQNRLMFSVLTDISEQVKFVINGQYVKADVLDVKDILSAGLRREQRIAQGLDGGIVLLGMRTSKMTVGEMADLITLAHAFGDERGVKWSKTSLGRDWPEEIAA